MPVTIDWKDENTTQKRPQHRFLILLAVLVALFIGVRVGLSWWVDWLWFDSLRFGEVFWRSRTLEWGSFAGFGLLTFVILYGVFRLLLWAHKDDLPGDHTVFVNGREVNFSLRPVLGWVGLGITALVGFLSGAAMAGNWATLALWHYAPQAAGAADPVFGRPLSFYLFTLPAWNLLAG